MALDVRRREVLGAGALGIAAVGIGGLLRTAAARDPRITVIEEEAAPESRQFAAALADFGFIVTVIRIDRSLNGLLYDLDDVSGKIVGLTSDPVAMIAGQLLTERGARALLDWRHDFHGGQWHHKIEGSARLLEDTTVAWPAAVAHRVRDELGGKSSGTESVCASGSCTLASSSPGMLVSWAYEIKGNLS